MKRFDIINFLIQKNSYKSYLEIGISHGDNYEKINCAFKTGVEPDCSNYKNDTVFCMTSNEFFEKHCHQKFDIIFIDGLHLEDQVDKDVENSLRFLSDNGTIVMHDCNPPTIHHAREVYRDFSTPAGAKWNGTVWRSIVKLRTTRDDLDICVVDTDWGCGVLRRANSETSNRFTDLSTEKCLEWNTFDISRKNILNLVQIDDFTKRSSV